MTMQASPVFSDVVEKTLIPKNRFAQRLYSFSNTTSCIIERLICLNHALKIALETHNKYLQARIFHTLADIDDDKEEQIYWYRHALKAASESKDQSLYTQIAFSYLKSQNIPIPE